MSETAHSSTSRVEIIKAFKRARRKFPKNFGLSSNAEEDFQSSESEDSSLKPVTVEESSGNDVIYKTTSSNQLESSLIQSVGDMKISEVEVHCDQYNSDNTGNIHQQDISTLHGEKFENNDHEQEYLSDVVHNAQNTCESPPKLREENSATRESQHSYGLIWKEELDNYNNLDSEIDTDRVYECPQKSHNEYGTSRKKRRCKKSLRHSDRYLCSHFATSDYICNDGHIVHSPNCPYYNYCIFCQHCLHHCCCYNNCCCSRCCSRCCMNCSIRIRESSSSACKKSSSHRRVKREKCATCKKRSNSPKSSTPQLDTCSRDSGIFTNVRYENENYNEDDYISSNPLLHKDSLSILQEKYASSNKRIEEKNSPTNANRISSRRCGYENRSEEDDDHYRNLEKCRVSKRLLSRCSNSY